MSNTFLPISGVVAVTPDWGIGMDGTLPWSRLGTHLPRDLKYFRETTINTRDVGKVNAVIMGRITWDSIPLKNRPLKKRLNIVISSTLSEAECNAAANDEVSEKKGTDVAAGDCGIDQPLDRQVIVARSLSEALEIIEQRPALKCSVEKAVVVGGAQLFEEALFHPHFHTLHLTQVAADFESDTFLPERTRAFLDSSKAALEASIVEDGIVESGVTYRYNTMVPSIFLLSLFFSHCPIFLTVPHRIVELQPQLWK